MNRVLRLTLLFIFGVFATAAFAQGGPPLITDDPGTPGNHHWEINMAYYTFRYRDLVSSQVPIADINYGYGDNVQLKVQFPYLLNDSPMLGQKQGWGDTDMGVKWRFIDHGDGKLQVSTYPQLTVNTLRQSVNSGLVQSNQNLYLPIEATQAFGWLIVDVEAGFDLYKVGPNDVEYGIILDHEFPKEVELLLEYNTIVPVNGNQTEPIVNLGVRYPFAKQETLLAAYGKNVGSTSDGQVQWLGYLGVQFHF